jgi:cobalt/nickel transport system permease protein
MQPIHLAIGLTEGIITAAVLSFVYKMRPEILESAAKGVKTDGVPQRKMIAIFIAAALLIGGGISIFASANPDGLEWAIAGITGSAELDSGDSVHKAASDIQKSTAIMPNYNFRKDGEDGTTSDSSAETPAAGTASAGILGGAILIFAAAAAGFIISVVKKRKKASGSEAGANAKF